MRALLPLILAYRLALGAAEAGPIEIPKSRSPDGGFALYYEPFRQGGTGSPDFAVKFSGADPAQVSGQIKPDFGDRYVGEPGVSWLFKEMSRWDDQTLLDMICDSNEFHRKKELFDSGFSYNVTWASDGHWVVIDGGAHKFWHLMIYYMQDGKFVQADSSNLKSQIASFFETHGTEADVQELGIARGLAARWGDYAGDEHHVTWMQEPRFAVLGYPFLLLDGGFGRLEEKGHIYFIVDCKNPRHLTVTGMTH